MLLLMGCTSGESNSGDAGGATTISDLHPDIILTHILTRLDGPALASVTCASSQLRALSSHEHLWSNACYSTWPSTRAPRVRQVISTFQNGSRSFFADSFGVSRPSVTVTASINPDRTPKLISAVDLFHRQRVLLSKVVETETESGWFRCSPFRIDLIDPKDVVRTPVKYPINDDMCRDLREELRLSWIVIDPAARRAVNVSSGKAVRVERHWLTGEVQVRFATVVNEAVMCSALVTWGGVEGGEMHVREVSLQMEDVEGTQLNGRDSLVILQRLLEGKNGNKGFCCYSYEDFVRRKKERKEEKARAEGRLDMMCVVLAALTLIASFFLFWIWN